MTGAGVAVLYQAAALCLEYPDERWRADLPILRTAAGTSAAADLAGFVDYATRSTAEDMTRHYVETFDLRRRCCPYLTYYAFGDTRKRGMALLRLRTEYRAGGFELTSTELPDHLAVVCEFAARRPDAGRVLLAEHRPALEVLHQALADAGSPYAGITEAIRRSLPSASPSELARALELMRSGPPAEDVGLEPFAPPEYMGARR